MQRFLSFSITADTQAMLPTEQLAEILSLSPSQIAPIPEMPPAVMGVCNWRGGILWLIDLADWLGLKPLFAQDWRQPNYSILIVQGKGKVLGLAISNVGQMIVAESAQIKTPNPNKTKSILSNSIIGQWQSPSNETFLILDVEALLGTPQLAG
jgi:positive phototaxis protein PixI